MLASSLQYVNFEKFKLTEGTVFTLTVVIAVFEQDCADKPITEYVVVTVGLTAILCATTALFQVYVEAPFTIRVIVAPLQIAVEVLNEIIGVL